MNQKELRMEEKKYLKSCCTKIICLGAVLLFFCISVDMCVGHQPEYRHEADTLHMSTVHTPYVGIRVSYMGKEHKFIMEEDYNDKLLMKITGKNYEYHSYRIYPMLRDSVFGVDCITYNALAQNGRMVMPSARIDSVYQGRKENLLLSFIEEIDGMLLVVDFLSESEKDYLVYLLFQHGVSVKNDCETGTLFLPPSRYR